MKPLTPEIEFSRATVKAWERLRLIYNGILLVPGVGLIWRTLHLQHRSEMDDQAAFVGHIYPIAGPMELVALAFVFGFMANVCFCLGPYAEFVVAAVGFPLTGQRTRYFVFGIGVMLSLGVMALPWLYVEYYFVSSLIPTIPAPAP